MIDAGKIVGKMRKKFSQHQICRPQCPQKERQLTASPYGRRHKNSKNTLLYIQLEEALFQDQIDFVSKIAKTEAEACVLIEAGFDFVCDFDGHKLFRKRK